MNALKHIMDVPVMHSTFGVLIEFPEISCNYVLKSLHYRLEQIKKTIPTPESIFKAPMLDFFDWEQSSVRLSSCEKSL